jgi:hypothetical protein
MLRNIKIDPTISLMGISPYELYKEYYDGKYSSIQIPKIDIDINQTCNDGLINPSYDQTGRDSMFSFTDRSGREHIFVSNNNDYYKKTHLDKSHDLPGGMCECCRKTYETGMGGIPVKVWYEEIDGKTVIVFGVIRKICDYRCALRFILDRSCGKSRFSSSFENDSETFLNMMYVLDYPNGPPLVPALDPSHLKSNDGHMTDEQWKSTKYVFSQTNDRMNIKPIKECYHRS